MTWLEPGARQRDGFARSAARIARGLALGATVALAAAPLGAAPGTWENLYIPSTQKQALLYVPAALDAAVPGPLVVYLYGTGNFAGAWQSTFQPVGDDLSTLILIPDAVNSSNGWGNPGDEQTIADAIAKVRAERAVDPRRISVVGYSAGGAYAYLLAYGTLNGAPPRFAGVFTLGAPAYAVTAVADPAYTAPIRMYYGDQDPNAGSGRLALEAQWTQLGVPWSEDFVPGYGHSVWPPGELESGVRFVLAQTYPGYSDTCSPTGARLCLAHGRFAVDIAWRTADGNTGNGHAVPLVADESGLFWFFSAGNIEMLVKALDGCAVNGKHWLFAAATTNVEFTLTVTDTSTGEMRTYQNALGHAAAPIQDTSAFATCP